MSTVLSEPSLLVRTLVVVPAFNEEETVAAVVGAVMASGYEVVVIDDGSSDWTARRAAAAGATVVRLPVNLGIGGALRCGFRYALDHGYEFVVQVDADGQHRPGEIASLLAEAHTSGACLVIGSRFASDDTFAVSRPRRIAMRAVAAVVRWRSGVALTDATSGFRAIRRPLLDSFAASYPREYLENVKALDMAHRAGFAIAEVPVRMDERASGASTASPFAAAWYVLRVVLSVLLRGGHRSAARSAPVSASQVADGEQVDGAAERDACRGDARDEVDVTDVVAGSP